MVAITLKESFSDRVTNWLLLLLQAVHGYVHLAIVKRMHRRLITKSRPQFMAMLSRIVFFQEHIDSLTESDRAELKDTLTATEHNIERLIPSMKVIAAESPEMDETYSLLLKIENEVAFLLARL